MTIPKFRVWIKEEKRMLPVASINFNQSYVLAEENNGLCCERDFDEIELMQSTGVVDENGKEVFENDVIRDSDGFEGIVQYDESYGMYGIAYLPAKSNGIDMTFEELKDKYWNTFEVVGNIYENPELFEKFSEVSIRKKGE
ncbi:YopX family protein [Streptococcus gallolyticus]|uniref:Phage uncharacterized protein TIGR01671 n=1 Tax=Streptococcus gallolyticus TaxID=315405 RepID=A0A1H9QHT0_9STRE|nr:YopX family protein [Streptococcus gallolyticus]SER59977.1 phage uncharacterized protein TIGR01671 [Streptococcus gallolyticus]